MSGRLLKEISKYSGNKNIQLGLAIFLLLIILVNSVDLRLSNLPILKDSTTEKYTTTDLDSLYFYREAETILNSGGLPSTDTLRSPVRQTPWIPEILPYILVGMYKVFKVFSPSITFDYLAAISGPIIYGVGLVIFFLFSLLLTKSKIGSLVATAILAYAPMYLFRTSAGFYDHDHLGVTFLFILVLVTLLSFKRLERNFKESIIWGAISGLATALVLSSWGGGITFVIAVFPLACLLYYLLVAQDKTKIFTFYVTWIISSEIFIQLSGFGYGGLFSRMTESYGIMIPFVLLFTLIDIFMPKIREKIKSLNSKKDRLYSISFTFILGILGLLILGKNPVTLITDAWARLIYPFFGGFADKLSATVAENSQPYLVDLMNQTGSLVFWMFIIGLVFICFKFTKSIKSKQNRFILTASQLLLFASILFSRYSSTSILNGENFLSQIFYLSGAIIFFVSLMYVSSKDKNSISAESIVIFSIAVVLSINARAASRSFFLIAPFICLIVGFLFSELINYFKKDNEHSSTSLWISVGLILISYIVLFGIPFTTGTGEYQSITSTAKVLGPSANTQWQQAMAWVRNETPQGAIFVHWWDYGYFVQTLGERPTVTDGGHAGGGVSTDHFIGRYILTTSNPKTAYSFMKTLNVSYFLVDPTEMSKYGAFSVIGSNGSWDRVSTGVASGVVNPKYDQETANGTIRIYEITQGGCVDEDIIYKSNSNNIFIPGLTVNAQQRVICSAYVAGIKLKSSSTSQGIAIGQPEAIVVYKNMQYIIPIKYLYDGKETGIFSEGIDGEVYIIPSIEASSNGGASLDKSGGIIYLSPRVRKGLLGQLYILNNNSAAYSGFTLAHRENDPAVNYLSQAFGKDLGEFVYFNGLKAPLKIWSITYPSDTETPHEFLNLQEDIDSGIYYTNGEMDKYFQ